MLKVLPASHLPKFPRLRARLIFQAAGITVSNNVVINVTGERFDESVGIYLVIWVVPKKGLPSTPYGGGVDKVDDGEGSFWNSSNRRNK